MQHLLLLVFLCIAILLALLGGYAHGYAHGRYLSVGVAVWAVRISLFLCGYVAYSAASLASRPSKLLSLSCLVIGLLVGEVMRSKLVDVTWKKGLKQGEKDYALLSPLDKLAETINRRYRVTLSLDKADDPEGAGYLDVTYLGHDVILQYDGRSPHPYGLTSGERTKDFTVYPEESFENVSRVLGRLEEIFEEHEQSLGRK